MPELQRAADLASSGPTITPVGPHGASDRAEAPQPSLLGRAGPRPHVQRLALGDSLLARSTRGPADPPPAVTGPADATQVVGQRAGEPDTLPTTDRADDTNEAKPGPSDNVVTVGTVDVSRLAIASPPQHARPVHSTRPLVGRLEPSSVQRQAADPTADTSNSAGRGVPPGERRTTDPFRAPEGLPASGPPLSEIAVTRFALPDAHLSAPTAPSIPVQPVQVEPNHSEHVEPPAGPRLVVARTIAQDPGMPAAPSPATRSTPVVPAARPPGFQIDVQRVSAPTTMPSQEPALPLARVGAPSVTVTEVQRARDSVADSAPSPRTSVAGSPADLGPDHDWPAAVQRESSEDALVQRAPIDQDSAPPSPAAASTGGGAAAAGGSEKDLDELARRLYDRFRLRLSRELLADRERSGALTDL